MLPRGTRRISTAEKLRDFEAFWARVWRLDARNTYYTLDCWAEFNLGDTPGFNGARSCA